MRREIINDHLMRVVLSMHDLESHGLTMVDLLSHSKAIDEFFHNVLREVDTDHQFTDTETLTFQILPSQDKIDLFISKPTDNPDGATDEIADVIRKKLFENRGQRIDNDLDSDDADKFFAGLDGDMGDDDPLDDDTMDDKSDDFDASKLENTVRVFKFKSIEDLIFMSKSIDIKGTANDLYTYDKAFYWAIKTHSMPQRLLLDEKTPLIFEYASKSKYPLDFLEEHGKLLVSDRALKDIEKYFK